MISSASLFQNRAKYPVNTATPLSFSLIVERAKIGTMCLELSLGLSSAWKNQKWPVSNPDLIVFVVSGTLSRFCVGERELCSWSKTFEELFEDDVIGVEILAGR